MYASGPRSRFLLWIVVFLLLEVPAQSCGPDWPVAVFVKLHGPDEPYAKFAAGRLGVPQPGYRTRHLAVLYRYLSGMPLSAEEQKAAVAANDSYTEGWSEKPEDHAGFSAWVALRQQFGPVDGYVPTSQLGTEHAFETYSFFQSCFEDAFVTATRTLHARATAYGTRSADVTEWVRGQDIVFQNCEKPAATPVTLPGSAALWLRQDRAYQMAATSFYAERWDEARDRFRAIAADTASPWSVVSRYLVGRTLAAQATFYETYTPPFEPNVTPEPDDVRRDRYVKLLESARAELLAMRSEPRMAPMMHAINAMLDHVNSRLDPAAQSLTIATRLTAAKADPTMMQDLVDLSFLRNTDPFANDDVLNKRPLPAAPVPNGEAQRRADDLLSWIDAMHDEDSEESLARWHASHKPVWLLAALTLAKTTDASTPELLAAARALSPEDPAYDAVTYQRLRLDLKRGELLAVLPRIQANEGPSTNNLYAALDARTAPTLEEWLANAGRTPAAQSVDGEDDTFDGTPRDQTCGPKLSDAEQHLFTPDAATVLNTRLPLRLLTQAALSTKLAAPLRFQVAQAAWTRAVLLDRQETAKKLAPVLIGCNANWRPVLEAYGAAQNADDRKAAGLFALMRFASTEPNVREGNPRDQGFATYSEYRDNWWCRTIPPPESKDVYDGRLWGGDVWGASTAAHPETPDPPFLTAGDKAEAQSEIATLTKIPMASIYFPDEALAWQAGHPSDPRTPELLGQAFRVVRNACTDKTSSEREHKLFLVLHQQYPDSAWTKRYKSWE